MELSHMDLVEDTDALVVPKRRTDLSAHLDRTVLVAAVHNTSPRHPAEDTAADRAGSRRSVVGRSPDSTDHIRTAVVVVRRSPVGWVPASHTAVVASSLAGRMAPANRTAEALESRIAVEGHRIEAGRSLGVGRSHPGCRTDRSRTCW